MGRRGDSKRGSDGCTILSLKMNSNQWEKRGPMARQGCSGKKA